MTGRSGPPSDPSTTPETAFATLFFGSGESLLTPFTPTLRPLWGRGVGDGVADGGTAGRRGADEPTAGAKALRFVPSPDVSPHIETRGPGPPRPPSGPDRRGGSSRLEPRRVARVERQVGGGRGKPRPDFVMRAEDLAHSTLRPLVPSLRPADQGLASRPDRGAARPPRPRYPRVSSPRLTHKPTLRPDTSRSRRGGFKGPRPVTPHLVFVSLEPKAPGRRKVRPDPWFVRDPVTLLTLPWDPLAISSTAHLPRTWDPSESRLSEPTYPVERLGDPEKRRETGETNALDPEPRACPAQWTRLV